MISIGVLLLAGIAGVLALMAWRHGERAFERGMQRAAEQAAHLIPRMVCALIAASFIAKLMPGELIARYLGTDAGLSAILVGTAAGLILPAGPVIAFAVAATFARADASVPALVAFITSWALFAAHRVFMYEIPLLGPSFSRLRLTSVAILPLLAGLIAFAAGWFVTLAQPGHL